MTMSTRAPGGDAGRADQRAGRSARSFWSVAAVYALVMLGGTLPVPLYASWSAAFGFGPFTITLIFAVYAMGVVASLLLFAGISDRTGRRPLTLAALVVAAASTVLFLLAGNVEGLLVARLLFGLATGVVTATATAWLEELAGPERSRRATVTATAATLGGLGLGPLVAALYVQLAPAPTRLVFAGYLAVLLVALVAIARSVENVSPRRGPQIVLRRPTVPSDRRGRRAFAGAAAGVFVVPILVLGALDQALDADLATSIVAVALIALTIAAAVDRRR